MGSGPAGCDAAVVGAGALGNAGCTEDAPHTRPRQVDALVLGEHLGQMVLVEAPMRRGRQLDHPCRDRFTHGVARSPSTIAVDQSSRALTAQRSPPDT